MFKLQHVKFKHCGFLACLFSHCKEQQQRNLLQFSTSVHNDYFNTARWRPYILVCSQSVCFLTLNLLNCPPSGDSVGSDPASGGSRSGPRKDGAGARFGACGSRQGPKPGDDDGSRRDREPHGGRPQTQSPGYSGGHSGGEGRADAALCGKDGGFFFYSLVQDSGASLQKT